RLLRARFAAQCHKIAISDGLRADEALLEVGMDYPGRARRRGPPRYGPGARLFGSGGEIGDEAQQPIARGNQPVEAGLRQVELCEIKLALLRIELRELRLDLGRDHNNLSALAA